MRVRVKTRLPISALVVFLIALSVHAEDTLKLDGWKPLNKPSVYNPQNVWDAINGAAEIYLDYGFQELLIQKFKKGESEIELEIYDQGLPINAFGIFRRERPPTAQVLSIGGEAAVSEPYTCMMFKGSYLARIKATSGGLKEPVCKEVLKGVAKSLKGREDRPEELAMLPIRDRIAGSEGYTPKNYLGISDLPGVLHAKYKGSGDETFELFTIIAANKEEVANTWQDLLAKWKHTAESRSCSLWRNIPYRGQVVVIIKESRIWGVSSSGDLEAAREWLKKTID